MEKSKVKNKRKKKGMEKGKCSRMKEGEQDGQN